MTYENAIQYLYTQLPMYQRIGKAAFKKDLGNIQKLLDDLGNPHRSFPSIHIAGTNGKGSVSHILASIFQANGFRTGLYTSPHYTDFRERIKINGKLIPKDRVSKFVAHCRHTWSAVKPSFFEITVAMAFDHFAREEVDIAIVETGLGGRLDSTNVLRPLLSVITNIDYDHMDMLGDTLPLIAREKAGIIKNGVPVVIGQKVKETSQVFREKSRSVDAPLYFAEDLVDVRFAGRSRDFQFLDVHFAEGLSKKSIPADLPGPFQVENIRTCLAAYSVFTKYYPGWEMSLEATIRSLSVVISTTYFIGRWQYIGYEPDIICDSGHNMHAFSQVLSALEKDQYEQIHCVIGFSKGKEVEKMLSVVPRNSRLYISRPDVPRGLDGQIVYDLAIRLGYDAKHFVTLAEAFRAAIREAGKKDLVFVGGSAFVVAEILALEGY